VRPRLGSSPPKASVDGDATPVKTGRQRALRADIDEAAWSALYSTRSMPFDPPPNFILGQTHFIKSVEDIHEALVAAVPGIKFGLAFCEASGKRLVR
jgi:hypothetical protein